MQSEQFKLNAELELSHWWFVARRAILRGLITELLPPSQGHRVVDVGCGTGGNISDLSQSYVSLGIDPSREAIDWARERFPATEFRLGCAPQDCLDSLQEAALVTLNDVLEHVPDDFRMITDLLASTRPGCLFLLTVPAEPGLWSSHDESHHHYRRYSMDRFRQLWSELPLTPLLVSPFNARLYPVVRLTRWLGSIRRKSFGSHKTDLRLPPAWQNQVLTKIFQGEQARLQEMLRGKATAYHKGVSLLAFLRRTTGDVTPCNRPDFIAPDPVPAWLREQSDG